MSLVGEWDIIGTTRENSSIYGVDGCNEPMFRIGYNTPLYTYTDERSAKAEP